MKYKIVVLSLLMSFSTFSQKNYRNYYALIDSAKYYTIAEKNYAYADSLYQIAFKNYDGFIDDISSSIINNYKIDSNLNYNYLELIFKEGESLGNVKFILDRKEIQYRKKIIRRCKRKGKKKRKISKNRKVIHKLRRMLIREQFARFRHKNINKIDSLNSTKIKTLLSKDSTILSRYKLGTINTEFLQIMILHQGWRYWGAENFSFLINLVEKGFLNRSVLAHIIDRSSIYAGKYFSVENNKMTCRKNTEIKRSCKNYYYSSIGFIRLNKNRTQTTIPFFPNSSITEINKTRFYILYSSLSLFKKTNPRIIFPSTMEFCEILKNAK